MDVQARAVAVGDSARSLLPVPHHRLRLERSSGLAHSSTLPWTILDNYHHSHLPIELASMSAEKEITLRESSNTAPRTKPPPKPSAIPVPFVYNPSDDGTDENLLILLHGLG